MRRSYVLFAVLATAAITIAVAAERDPAPSAPGRSALASGGRLAEEAKLDFIEHVYAMNSDPAKALYLAAVRAVELAEAQGDAAKALPFLTSIVEKSTKQSVRTSVRRLISDIHADKGRFEDAQKELDEIVKENLAQF